MNALRTDELLRTSLPAQAVPRLVSPTMYLALLRSHLARGKAVVGEVIDAVSDVLPAASADQSAPKQP